MSPEHRLVDQFCRDLVSEFPGAHSRALPDIPHDAQYFFVTENPSTNHVWEVVAPVLLRPDVRAVGVAVISNDGLCIDLVLPRAVEGRASCLYVNDVWPLRIQEFHGKILRGDYEIVEGSAKEVAAWVWLTGYPVDSPQQRH